MKRSPTRPISFLVVLMTVTALSASPVLAGAIVERFSWQQEFNDLGAGREPCLPGEDKGAALTIVVSGRAQVVETGSTYLFSGSQHGTFVLDPDDPELPTYSGMYRDSISFNLHEPYGESFVMTVTLVGHAADGSRLASNARFKATLTQAGLLLAFIKLACGGAA